MYIWMDQGGGRPPATRCRPSPRAAPDVAPLHCGDRPNITAPGQLPA